MKRKNESWHLKITYEDDNGEISPYARTHYGYHTQTFVAASRAQQMFEHYRSTRKFGDKTIANAVLEHVVSENVDEF